MTCDPEHHRAHRWAIYDRYGIFYKYVCDRCAHTVSKEQLRHLETYEPDYGERVEDDY